MRVDIYRRTEAEGKFSHLVVPEGRPIPQEAINTDWESEMSGQELDESAAHWDDFGIAEPGRGGQLQVLAPGVDHGRRLGVANDRTASGQVDLSTGEHDAAGLSMWHPRGALEVGTVGQGHVLAGERDASVLVDVPFVGRIKNSVASCPLRRVGRA